MLEIVKQAYEVASKSHEQLYLSLIYMRGELNKLGSLVESTDGVFVLKEIVKILEDSRKETNKLLDELKRSVCLRWVSTPDPDVIRTDYCTGTPSVKRNSITPKPGTPEYVALCEYFGIDPTAPFRPHWKSMGEVLTALEAAGRPAPPGFDPSKTISVFDVATRRKIGVSIPSAHENVDVSPAGEFLRERAEVVAAATVDALRGQSAVLTNAELRVVASMASRIIAMRASDEYGEHDLDETSSIDPSETPF